MEYPQPGLRPRPFEDCWLAVFRDATIVSRQMLAGPGNCIEQPPEIMQYLESPAFITGGHKLTPNPR